MSKNEQKYRRANTDTRFVIYFYMAVVVAAAFIIGFFKIYNYDIWWHLKTGELILTEGLPRTDVFSFTAYGRHWVTHEWLAQVFFYLLHKLGGINALVLLKGVMTALTAFIIYRFGIRKGVVSPLAAAVTILVIAGLSFRIFARPHIFTFVLLALLLTILFKDSSSKKAFIRDRWIILPVIMIVWANIQAGFFIGLGIYWIVTLKELFITRDRKADFGKRFNKLVLPTIFATAVCLINPNGFDLFTYPLLVAGNPYFKSTIAEWVSPLELGSDEWLAKSILVFTLILALLTTLLQMKRRFDISLIVLVAGGASLWAMRNVADFMIIMGVSLLAVPKISRFKLSKLSKLKRYGIMVVSLFWIILCFHLVRDYQASHGRLGLTPKKGYAPEGPARFLKDAGFKGNIVNLLQDGGYLIWTGYPQWRVFVDGRILVYGEEQINNYRMVVAGSPGAMDIIDRLKVGAVVVNMPPKMGRLRDKLSDDDNWVLAFFDDYYLVYLKDNNTNKAIIENHGCFIIDPLKSGYTKPGMDDPDLYFYEAMRAYKTDSLSSLKNSIVGNAYQLKGDFLAAANAYKKAVEIWPLLSGHYSQIGSMYMRAGIIDSSITWYNKVIESEPRNPQVHYYLGLLYYRKGDLETAKLYLKNSISIYPKSPARKLLDKIEVMKPDSKQ